MEGQEKKTTKILEGWREEGGGGGKRKRMGEEKGVQAENIIKGLIEKASGAAKRLID